MSHQLNPGTGNATRYTFPMTNHQEFLTKLQEIPAMATQPTNGRGMTYEVFMTCVDRFITSVCGLTSSDLPDGPSWDAWNDDETPATYARTLLEDDGFPFEVEL